MPWIHRGLRDGVVTSDWPHRSDDYFDTFAAAIGVDDPMPGTVGGIEEVCPTGAVVVDRDGSRVRVDRGRCILCGRCVQLRPDVFGWSAGSAVARDRRDQLVVGDLPETDENLELIRAELGRRVRVLRRSAHIRHVDAGSDGSDEWEVQALTNPVYDLHRLGIFFTASPRHADILLVTGIGAGGMWAPLRRTREAMPEPVVVIAAGVEALSGGVLRSSYAGRGGIGDLLDVDIWVPGSPASPFSLLHAILLALGRVGATERIRPRKGIR